MKRFTETEKWRDVWFRKLSIASKMAYNYILENCDAAGVWEPDFEFAAFCMGDDVDWEAFKQDMAHRLEVLPNGKWYLTRFIAFQYGDLSKDCIPHRKIINLLKTHGIDPEKNKGIARVVDTLSTGRGEEEEKTGGVGEFVEAWNGLGRPFAKVSAMTGGRLRHLKARLSEPWWCQNWRNGLTQMRNSEFCRGHSDRGWKAGVDWFLKPDTLPKILEGQYGGGGPRPSSAESPPLPDLTPEQDAINRVAYFRGEAKNTPLANGMWEACKMARKTAGTALPDDLKSWFESEERRQGQNAL